MCTIPQTLSLSRGLGTRLILAQNPRTAQSWFSNSEWRQFASLVSLEKVNNQERDLTKPGGIRERVDEKFKHRNAVNAAPYYGLPFVSKLLMHLSMSSPLPPIRARVGHFNVH
jgi:hypothetical protein